MNPDIENQILTNPPATSRTPTSQGYHRIGQDGTLEHFKNAEMVTLSNAEHRLHHDQPEQVVALVRQFLRP